MEKLKACIFDLDGVIVDTAHYHFLAWQRLGEELGVPFDEHANEQLKGVSRMGSLEIILGWGNVQLDEEEKHRFAEKKNGWYVEYISEMGPEEILPGVNDFFDELEENNIKVAIASSSKNAGRVIDNIGFRDRIHELVDGNMVTHGKPDPELFLLSAQKLDVAPEDCVVYEDAYSGVEAANRAGMLSIGIGSAEVLTNTPHVIPGFEDFHYKDLLAIISS